MSKKPRKKDKSLEIPKSIKFAVSATGLLSKNLQTRLAARLFATPLRHRAPERERHMIENSRKSTFFVPEIDKSIQVYEYGNPSDKKILLVHGWSGRGTQLVKIADALLADGYATVSFDAPAHGNSPGKTTLMTEFIASILELEKKYGPFEAAIGHSLGGMSLLNSVKEGFRTKALVIIGSGDKVSDILKDFARRMGQKQELAERLRKHFERKFNGRTMESYSAWVASEKTGIPVLVIHDNQDVEVPVSAADNIVAHLPNGEIFKTDGLGHRKILGNADVIRNSLNFIRKHSR